MPENSLVFYFSQRALNEIDDSRLAANTRTAAGEISARMFGLSRSRAVTTTPSSRDQVGFALRAAHKHGRRTLHDAWAAGAPGQVFDIAVNDLHVGVMPFLRLGMYGESTRAGKVRAFWATTVLEPVAPGEAPLDLILIGSRDNVVNKTWSTEAEEALKVGHSFPSEPGAVGHFLSWELQIAEDEHVRRQLEANDYWAGMPEPGEEARTASDQTARARETLVEDDGYATSWERRAPLASARVVGITRDVFRSPTQKNVLLGRPVFIDDLS